MFTSVNSHLAMVFVFYLLNPIFNFELTQYKQSETNPLLIQQHFQLDLFDKIVKPILLYGCEVWGVGNNDIVERICKILLYVKKNYGIRRAWEISDYQ